LTIAEFENVLIQNDRYFYVVYFRTRTGPFVTMIYSMITGDMFTFSIIYMIFLFGFSQAYFFLYKGHENVEETPYNSYMSTWMGLFQMTLGDYDVRLKLLMELR
jgi:hypothetical protein